MNKIFSLITNSEIPTLYINGYVGGEKVNTEEVTKLLQQVQGQTLNMEVNSGGGSMMEGFAIYDALKNSGKTINVTITGLAGSMASVLILAGNRISMYKHARIMTHRPHLICYGEPESAISEANLALDMERQVKELFKARTGKSDKEINSWFIAGADKWFNSTQALDSKIVDEIIESVEYVEDIPSVSSESELINIYNNFKIHNMSKTTIVLNANTANNIGMQQNTDSDALVERAEALALENKTLKSENDTLKAEAKTREDADKVLKETQATKMVENAIKAGKIEATKKESFVKMAVENYTDVKAMLDGIVAKAPIHAQISNNTMASATNIVDRSNWTYMDWAKQDPKGLEELRTHQPEVFNQLKSKK